MFSVWAPFTGQMECQSSTSTQMPFPERGPRCFLVMQLCCSRLTLGALGIFCPFTPPHPLAPFQIPWLLMIFFPLPKFASLDCPSFPLSFFHAGLLKFLMQLFSCCLVLLLNKRKYTIHPYNNCISGNTIMGCQSKPQDQWTRRWLVDAPWLLVIYFLLNLPPCHLEISFMYKQQLSYNIKYSFYWKLDADWSHFPIIMQYKEMLTSKLCGKLKKNAAH